MAWSVSWGVAIDGADVTVNMRPFLISIEVVDKDGTASDACRLVFDDTGGQCLLPKKGAGVVVTLQGVPIFEGTVDSTPWRLSRGGGRVLEIAAKGLDTRGKAKAGQLWHLDDASLQEALDKAAKRAGLSAVIVDQQLAAIQRPYWSPEGASFLAWGERLAREFGATFKIRGARAVFVKRGSGVSAAGGAMPVVLGYCGPGGNVIAVPEIDPSRGRARFKEKRVRYFDRETATFKEKRLAIEDSEGDLDVVDTQRWPAADESQAETMAEGQKADAEREAGLGQAVLDLDVAAQAEGTFILSGARPGIDGSYRITGVTQRADRSGGAQTTLDLAQPQGDAGKDDSKPSGQAAGRSPALGSVPVPTPAPR